VLSFSKLSNNNKKQLNSKHATLEGVIHKEALTSHNTKENIRYDAVKAISNFNNGFKYFILFRFIKY
jgi:hypothetical protein